MFRIRYGKIIVSCAAFAAVALFLTLVLTHTGPAKPRPAPLPPVTDVLSNGTYLTAINIHNPSLGGNPLTLYKRAVLAPAESDTTAYPPHAFHGYSLLPGYAVEIDCTDIYTLLLPDAPTGLIEGFVTVLAKEPLDVVGVYTAEPPTVSTSPLYIPGIALEMLNITPRVLGPAVYEYSAKFLCGEALIPLLTR